MTRTTTARIAGFTCLFYVAVGSVHEVLMSRATHAEGTAATLARVAEHVTSVRVSIVLALLECVSALVLAVTLYGITRDVDREVAMLGLVGRVAEGVIGAIGISRDLGLSWLAQVQAVAGAPDAATTQALGAVLLMPNGPVGAVFFAVGSTAFAYLLLRGRIVPAPLAGLGVFASGLLVIGLPLQLAGVLTGRPAGYQWLPEIVYTVGLGLWLLVKGAAAPATR
jgi:hypothetical protein